jgi:hypothetical protein
VVAEKHHGSGSGSTAGLAGRLAAARAAAGTRSGAGGLGGSTGLGSGTGATTGTVIDVQGDVVDISDSNGNIVKVTIGPSTVVTRTSAARASSLEIGDTLVVTGPTGAPTAVRATAQGVRAGGGFSPGG